MIDQNNKQLSPAGVVRKKAMLSQLVGQMKHIHNARRVRRRIVYTFSLVIVCAITVWVVSLKISSSRRDVFVRDTPSEIKQTPTVQNKSSQTSNTTIITHGFRSDPSPQILKTTLVKAINDDELIALLAEINRPTGIVRSEGRIWLTNPVTDEELGISQDIPIEDPSSM